MPRTPRQLSKTGIYHIIVRGINRQPIFSDEKDYLQYLNTLYRSLDKSDAVLLSYCLMNNHVHLLIHDLSMVIDKVMKSIGVSYAYWFNHKYERNGHVFQGRYKSENVEDDAYLMTVIRYIHQNPVKAGIVSAPEKYLWSSCGIYYGIKENTGGLIKTSFILDMFSKDRIQAISAFRRFMEEAGDIQCMEDSGFPKILDSEAIKIMSRIMNGQNFSSLYSMSKSERNKFLKSFKKINGISLRQIARITGIGYQTINRA